MYYEGGTLRFGKLLMLDAEMQIVDLDPSDPFKFDLDRYARQLVAGYSRSLADGGLEVFMRMSTSSSNRATPPETELASCAAGAGSLLSITRRVVCARPISSLH
jgi:hypothetical protein